MDMHKNARLTPKGREQMVRAVVDGGLSKAAAARRYKRRQVFGRAKCRSRNLATGGPGR
jgi:transposase-like protein